MTNIPKLNGFKERMLETFLPVPEAKMFPSNAGDVGAIPGQGGEIQHALWPENQITKRKQRCSKFNTDFENGPHQMNKRIHK